MAYQRPKLKPNPHRSVWQSCTICGDYLTPNEQFLKPTSGKRSRSVICKECGDGILDRNERLYRLREGQSEGQMTFDGEIVQNGQLVKVGDQSKRKE